VRTKKLNPACRLQRDMLTAIKSVKRALVLLHEHEDEKMALLARRTPSCIDNHNLQTCENGVASRASRLVPPFDSVQKLSQIGSEDSSAFPPRSS
jgi:hypothetical protein